MHLPADRVFFGELKHLEGRDGQFRSAGRALIQTDQAGHRQRRLLRHLIGFGKGVCHSPLPHTLTEPGPIAHQQKDHLSASPLPVQPTTQPHRLTGQRF